MVIFLYGQDSYRSRQKLNEIIEEYKKTHKSGLNLKFLDVEEVGFSIDNLTDETRQSSIFKEKKLVVVKNLFNDADLKEKFLKIVKEMLDSEEIVVLYEEQKIKKSDSLLKFLKKSAKVQEFESLSGVKLSNWVKKEIESRNIKIDPIAQDLLLDYVGEDLWWLSNELQKLSNFKKNSDGKVSTKSRILDKVGTIEDTRLRFHRESSIGSGQSRDKTITIADVKLLVKPKIETDIFKTIDAIAQKNKKQALNLLYKHLEDGDAPLYLLSMIGYQFRNLLIVKDLAERNTPYNLIAKKSGLHPFVVRKAYDQMRQFSLQELKKIYQRIFEVDLNIKTGRIEPEIALEMLIMKL
ncbi:hypothetical protein KJ786_00840 [Patescibacteria group bacterium]|nr:hypothetical protein [Patescibacteria group bacterium]